MVLAPAEPRTWVLMACDEAVVLAQWLEIELTLGAHAIELRGASSPERRWSWTPQGLPITKTPTHTDWRRALAEAPDDGGRAELEARALAAEILAVAARELGGQEAEVRSHGALIRAGENVCRLGDARRGEILRRAVHDVGDPSTVHEDARRAKLLALLLGILRADAARLAKLADRLTSEEIAALDAIRA